MKKFSKILSVALLVALVLSLGISSAFAEGETTPADTDPQGRQNGEPLTNKSITLTNPSAGHKYALYQIFTGTFARVNGEEMLGNLAWGSGVDVDAATAEGATYKGMTATEAAATITAQTAAAAQAFAIAIDPYLTGGSEQTALDANPVSLVWNNLSEGYYIIKDITVLEEGESADAVVVQVLDDVTIKAKAGTTEFDKKVRDRNDSDDAPTVYDQWGNTSDYDVGDVVPFQLTITLPANFSSYESYDMIVKDNMGEGLVFDDTSVQVFVGNSETALTSGYEVVTEGIEETFQIVFEDVKAINGAGDGVTFTIYYNATLNGDNIVYGNPGNPNEAWLRYSNNPTSDSHGDTPKKTTVTFTYKFEVDKIDENNQPLDGAAFKLEKAIMGADGTTISWTDIGLVEGTSGTIFTFDGLDDGLYKITETETPAGYNSIEPVYFRVEATHTATLDKLDVYQVELKDGEYVKVSTADATMTFDFTLTLSAEKNNNIHTDVKNQKGTVLPSTGGIGTTIFYVVGGVLVLAAIILLVTKKRMSE